MGMKFCDTQHWFQFSAILPTLNVRQSLKAYASGEELPSSMALVAALTKYGTGSEEVVL
jgi:hypothetical protein